MAGSRNTVQRIAYTVSRSSASGSAKYHAAVRQSLMYMTTLNTEPRVNSARTSPAHFTALPGPDDESDSPDPLVGSESCTKYATSHHTTVAPSSSPDASASPCATRSRGGAVTDFGGRKNF